MLESLMDKFGVYISNISSSFRQVQLSDIESGLISKYIQVDNTHQKLRGPYLLNTIVVFPEVFLNFQWCMCYYFINLTELYSKRTLLTSTSDGKKIIEEELDKGLKCMTWAMGLRKEYSDWPDSIENPNNESEIIKIVNDIFLNSIAFIHFHEYGHAKLRHVKVNNAIESKIQENEADHFSLSTIYNELKNNLQKDLYIIGAACSGLCILYSTTSINQVQQKLHPDIDIRILNIIDYFDLQDKEIKSYVEKIIIFGFKLYLSINSIKCENDANYKSNKEEIDFLVSIIEKSK